MKRDGETITVAAAEPGIVVLTFNRPHRLNAYNQQFCREVAAALDDYLADDDTHVLILTGAGRAFCVGGDMKGDTAEFEQLRATQLGESRSLREGLHAVNRRLWALDKPVIAAVNGLAISGGLTMALLCDIRIAGRSARIGDTAGRAGLLPDEGAAWILPRVLGYDRAWLLVMSHELIQAETALAWGAFTRVVDDDQVMPEALAIARVVAAGAPMTQRLAKRLLRSGAQSSFDDALTAAGIAADIVIRTPDADEGKAAFREKRPPRFTGAWPLSSFH